MRFLLTLTAVPLLAGMALAQSTEPQTTPQSSSQPTMGTERESDTRPAEMKTQTFKGVLTDASCAMPGSAARTGSTQPGSQTPAAADRTETAPSETRTSEEMRQGDANRTTAGGHTQMGQTQSCPVTASTSAFALKLNDGRVVGFDSVGNQRAQDAIKNKKKWNEASTSGKPIKAKVDGVLTGDKLLVVSIR